MIRGFQLLRPRHQLPTGLGFVSHERLGIRHVARSHGPDVTPYTKIKMPENSLAQPVFDTLTDLSTEGHCITGKVVSPGTLLAELLAGMATSLAHRERGTGQQRPTPVASPSPPRSR